MTITKVKSAMHNAAACPVTKRLHKQNIAATTSITRGSQSRTYLITCWNLTLS